MKTRDSRSDLVRAYVEGRATADEVQRLEIILRASPEFRRRFLEHLNVDGALAEFANRAEGAAELLTTPRPTTPDPARPLPRNTHWLAIAASVTAAVGIAVWGLYQRTELPSSAGTRLEIVASYGGNDYSSGQVLSDTRLSIGQGWLSLQLDTGPILELSAPADIEILNGMHVRVHRGDVTIDVGDQTDGFIIDTATARVLDLGTRFAVSVDPNGATDVVVLDGEIEVSEPPGTLPTSRYASLLAGEALTISASNAVQRLTAVTMTPRVARLGRGGSLGVVTGISDDATSPGYRRFYGLVPGGMRENAPAYTTIGRARWRPAVGADFPAELLGADAVRTFHDDRRSWDLNIILDVAGPSSVYVIVDARNPTPDWLRDEFSDTGMQLRTGPWRDVGIVDDVAPHTDGGLYVTYRVWKREVLAAGAVTLGPPRTPGQPGNRAMYGIAVQAM